MKFFIQKGQIVLTGLFVVLLVVHTIFIFSYNAKVKNYFASENEVSDQTQVLSDPSGMSAGASTDKNEIAATTSTANILQVLLILAGFAFSYLFIRNTMQNRKRLDTMMRELEESNNTFIFNSSETVDNQNEEAVKARLILNLKKARE